jgi:hypothetical protein
LLNCYYKNKFKKGTYPHFFLCYIYSIRIERTVVDQTILFTNAFADISIDSLMPDEYSNDWLLSSFGIKFKTGSLRLRSYSLSIETALRKKAGDSASIAVFFP